jgi:hypothetical protein
MPLPERLSRLPEHTAWIAYLRDILNWEDCLRACTPSFAKRLIMCVLRPESLDDIAAQVLIQRLNLGEA